MYVVAAAQDEADLPPAPDGLSYGVPCVFDGCRGMYHPAGGAIGVVLCAPWGFEDLSMRKGWRLLAEAIAEAGFPCLRFDYPCTGDSLGRATDVVSTAAWVASIGAAAATLRKLSGVRGFVFVGQSLGATLAVEAARGRRDVVGLQLVAPVLKGRAHMRELAVTATMVADKIGIEADLAPDEGLSVVGFSLSPAMVDSIKALDLTRVDDLHVSDVTIYDQPDRAAGVQAAMHLRGLGARVTMEALAPFHVMISDALAIQPLPVSSEAIVTALRALCPQGEAWRALPLPPMPAILTGATFQEEAVRFGPESALFGMLCLPARPRQGAAGVVLLNRGLNAHVGWRRVSVDHARGLAAAGIASLRIDVAGLGESRDEPGRPVNLIYSDLLLPDIAAAVDVLVARGHQRIALAGVCSGAYMALTAAAVDPRVTDIVAVNPQRFVWNPSESVDDVIRYGLRSVNDYVGDIKSRDALRKLIRSRKRIVPAFRFLARRSLRDLSAGLPLGLRSALLHGSMAARVQRFFDRLEANATRVSLVYTQDDPGRTELRHYFGPDGRDLRYANVSVSILDQADHNLTTTRASCWMLNHMIQRLGTVPHEPPARREARHLQPAHS